MSESARHTPFNSPLETGIRSLSILVAAYPASLDIQRLVEMDYLVVHSGDAGGPESLHVPLPRRIPRDIDEDTGWADSRNWR